MSQNNKENSICPKHVFLTYFATEKRALLPFLEKTFVNSDRNKASNSPLQICRNLPVIHYVTCATM